MRGARTQAHENDRIELAVFDRQAGVGDPRPHDCLLVVIIRVGGGRRPPRGGEAPAFYFRSSLPCARCAPKRMKTESSGNGVGPGRRPGPTSAGTCGDVVHAIDTSYFRNSLPCARCAPKRMKTESSGNGVGPGRRPGPTSAGTCGDVVHAIDTSYFRNRPLASPPMI